MQKVCLTHTHIIKYHIKVGYIYGLKVLNVRDRARVNIKVDGIKWCQSVSHLNTFVVINKVVSFMCIF